MASAIFYGVIFFILVVIPVTAIICKVYGIFPRPLDKEQFDAENYRFNAEEDKKNE